MGDAVNSMVPSVRSCSGTWPAKPQPSFPEGKQRPETQLKVPESRQSGTGDSQRVRSQVPRVLRCPLEQSREAADTSNQQESRVGTSRELKTVCKPTAQNAGSPAPTPSSLSLPSEWPRSGEVTISRGTLEGAETRESDLVSAERNKARPKLSLGACCLAP